jgi:stress response protein YsnF
VHTRHEEVNVERVPVEEGRYATPGKIDKEEVVTEKRPMVKEEIRVRMDVVEEEGVIEEDVRKEEIDVEDSTTRGGSREAILDEAGKHHDR